jgi:hypothetical protein
MGVAPAWIGRAGVASIDWGDMGVARASGVHDVAFVGRIIHVVAARTRIARIVLGLGRVGPSGAIGVGSQRQVLKPPHLRAGHQNEQ